MKAKKKKIIFLTFYKQDELKSKAFSLNGKAQDEFFLYSENIKGNIIYINELDLDIKQFNNAKKGVSIEWNIIENKNNLIDDNDENNLLSKEKKKYIIETEQIENDINFIFDYNKNRMFMPLVNDPANKIINWISKFIGKFSNSEKFLFFFDYLLKTKNGFNENNKNIF